MPAASSAAALARPMPELAPVTIATRCSSMRTPFIGCQLAASIQLIWSTVDASDMIGRQKVGPAGCESSKKNSRVLVGHFSDLQSL